MKREASRIKEEETGYRGSQGKTTAEIRKTVSSAEVTHSKRTLKTAACIYPHACMQPQWKKKAIHEFEREQERGTMGGFGGKKEKGEII